MNIFNEHHDGFYFFKHRSFLDQLLANNDFLRFHNLIKSDKHYCKYFFAINIKTYSLNSTETVTDGVIPILISNPEIRMIKNLPEFNAALFSI